MTDEPEEKPVSERQVECQIWSRVVGFLRPVDDWNKAKQHEFAHRDLYDDSVKREDYTETYREA